MTQPGHVILIVEDDASMSHAIRRLLSAAGLQTRSFFSAEDLLGSSAVSSASLLILDIQLTGMSGIELYRLLLASGATPPVIFITGQDRPDLQRMLLGEGAAGYFAKPFNGGELIRAIHQELKPR